MAETLCHLLMKVNYAKVAIFNVANMSFNANRENEILAKIYEFTVSDLTERWCNNIDFFCAFFGNINARDVAIVNLLF